MIIAKRLLYWVFVLGIISASAQTRPGPAAVPPGIRPGSGACERVVVVNPGVPSTALASAVVLPDLTGTYSGDDGGLYYMQQSGSTLWWAGLSIDPTKAMETQWHRGLDFTHVFSGTIFCDGHIEGRWADVPRGAALGSGTLNLVIDSPSGGLAHLRQTASTGGMTAKSWRKMVHGLNDIFIDGGGTGAGIVSRFDRVLKNPASQDTIPPRSSLLDNLKPYRDQTVVFGHITTVHPDPLAILFPGEILNQEAPHVNFAVADFNHKDRLLRSFCKDPNDGDFDFRLKVEKFETAFATTGWGNNDHGPEIFKAKFDVVAKIPGLTGFKPSDTYLGLESIMYGRLGTCDDGFTAALLPGWADLESNSVLINGRPINGAAPAANPDPNQPCIFIQPCTVVDPAQPLNNGIQLGKLLLTAKGQGAFVRITGTLVLDCGHDLTSPCYDDPNDLPSARGNLNQEIHPIYSIDVINSPFRPEDANVGARENLTGVWAGPDGSTYYIRQIGNTIWWLGQMRDRQPMQGGTHSPIIGSEQLAPAFAANDPPCGTVPPQCWAFATVFTGTLMGTADGGATIQGTWAGVPQSASSGSSGGHMTFIVDSRHKAIFPETAGSIFPALSKMYEPEDATPPKSVITVAPVKPSGLGGPRGAVGGIAASAKQVTITATDQGSGVQNIWYRFYAHGDAPPASYTFAPGATVSFTTAGGSYRVEFYATDNAGNDETLHSVVVGVPVAVQ